MKYWIEFAALKVVQLLLLVSTVLFLVLYPAMWTADMHMGRWAWVPIELFAVTRVVVPVLVVFGWLACYMASRRLRRSS